MTNHLRMARALLLAAALTPAIAAGAAQANDISFISIAGSNANACTFAAPCRSLQRAVGVTAGGGEIRVLDSGFFGNNAVIRKSLTISGNGHTIFLGSPIVVDKAGVVVALRGLVLDGKGTILHGINIVDAATVHIERCVIHGFTQDGIRATAPGVAVFVLDSISRDNGSFGLIVVSAGASRLTIDNSRFENNATGVGVASGHATIHRSTASGNVFAGIIASNASVGVVSTVTAQNGSSGFEASGGSGPMTVESSLAHGNGASGLRVFSGAIARISNSIFTNNATGILNTGTVETRQNNTVRGNSSNVSGALTPIGGL